MKKNYTTRDSFAQTQLGRLGAKSALYRIQWPTRLFAFLGWIGLLFAGIYYPITVGLALFGVGFLNYVLLLSFRISNNFFKKPTTTDNAFIGHLSSWPSFSILVPLKNEDEVIHVTLRSIEAFDYPQYLMQVIIVVEETDQLTRRSLRSVTLPSFFKVLLIPALPPYTKGRALLHALPIATGEYITVYDAESRPEPSQLRKAAWALAEAKETTCFQAKISISNRSSSWISRHFAGEYYEWYERHMRALSAQGLPFGLGGNSFFLSKNALEKAGAWDPFNVTEDADLSVRLIEQGVKLQLLESITTESCPDSATNWINQRTRWNKGLFITQLVHLRRTLFSRGFGLEGWSSFWLPMISSALTPFFNIYIPIFMIMSDLSYATTTAMSLSLWMLLAFNLGCSWVINFKTYRELGIKQSALGIFWDTFRYLFLHLGAGFKAYGEYFLAPMHWHKTDHTESEKSNHTAPSPEAQFSLS